MLLFTSILKSPSVCLCVCVCVRGHFLRLGSMYALPTIYYTLYLLYNFPSPPYPLSIRGVQSQLFITVLFFICFSFYDFISVLFLICFCFYDFISVLFLICFCFSKSLPVFLSVSVSSISYVLFLIPQCM